MSTPSIIIHKRTAIPGAVPPASAVRLGEIALNVADGKLFFKNTGGSIITIGSGGTQTSTLFVSGASIGSIQPLSGSNVALGQYSSITGGAGAKAYLYGQEARASKSFVQAGDAQTTRTLLYAKCEDSSPVSLTTPDGSLFDLSNRANATLFAGTYDIVGVTEGGAYARFYGLFDLAWNGSEHILISVHSVQAHSEMGVLSVTADAANGLNFLITDGTPNSRWIATITGTEIEFPLP